MSHLKTSTTVTQVLVMSSERSGRLRVLPFGRNKDFVSRESKLGPVWQK
jgi:hypothetical protein